MSKEMIEYESKKKSGFVAALLNLFIPGAGYMYCGNIILGLFVLADYRVVFTKAAC